MKRSVQQDDNSTFEQLSFDSPFRGLGGFNFRAIVDCNSFYCSCERLFKPSLWEKPVVVLSNNDGCIIALTDEARRIGVGMAAPYYQNRDLIKQNDVAVFSSNYNLYGDLSMRVMQTLRTLVGDNNVEVYSVDESFLDLHAVPFESLHSTAKEIMHTIPGYRTNEYLLVLNPHEELRLRITAVKKEFFETYELPMNAGSKSHMALVRFKQLEMMEEKILARLKTVAMGYHPFKVELRNYGSYPTHSIYINVTTKEPVKNLVKQIKPWQRLLKLDNDNKPHFIDDPHITVATKLIPWQYEKSWLDFSNRTFTGRFIADSMLLLRRRQGEKGWQILQRFEFQNLPVVTKQGELFV